MEFEAENKKMLEVLHRSKEQRYAFDKIYRDHTSEEVRLDPRRFMKKQYGR